MKTLKNILNLLPICCLLSACSPEELKFNGLNEQITVTTTEVTAITQTTASSGVQVSAAFSEEVLRKGICWATIKDPTTNNTFSNAANGSGIAALNMTSLNSGTIYYVRAYAVTSRETIYGNARSFTTPAYQASTISTTAIASIGQTSATSGGTITAAGGGTITARGICWNTTGSPTTSNNYTSDGTGTGTFSSTLNNLTAGTTYYVRAYALNQAGTAYGNQVSFTTSPVTLATLTSPSISGITQTGANSSATVSSAGGGTVSAYGICWNTTGSPTISNSRTIDGSGTGAFSSLLGGLAAGTTYYVRSYATNQAGTAYSTQASFNTSPVQLATLTSASISNITKTSATGTASVTADGGGTVTAKGLCWSSSTSSPTITSSIYATSGSGTGTISISMTGLVTGTTYYVRSFATNAAGTAYGSVVSFRTL
ncbi:MAG: hypothetical protein V4592_08125 [Bacteroidota bacterium]